MRPLVIPCRSCDPARACWTPVSAFGPNASTGVGLQVEEDLDVSDPCFTGSRQVRVGQVGKVLLCLQDLHVGVVEVQERLQVAEVIASSQIVDVSVGQSDGVPLAEGVDLVGFEGALEVKV